MASQGGVPKAKQSNSRLLQSFIVDVFLEPETGHFCHSFLCCIEKFYI